MEAAKRKQIETQLRRLIEAAERDQKSHQSSSPCQPGAIQVIRRRNRKPGQHIVKNRRRSKPAESDREC